MYIYKLTTTFFFTLVKYEKIKKKLGFKVVITIEGTHRILCNKKKMAYIMGSAYIIQIKRSNQGPTRLTYSPRQTRLNKTPNSHLWHKKLLEVQRLKIFL